MKILMLAPEPFFQPRGTPISVNFRIQALSDLGHTVDLVTYHLGDDRAIKNLNILRIPDVLFIKTIRIGPSLAKIPLDFLLLLKTVFQLTKKSYDVIFSHEEAALFGAALAKIWRIPHIYDMHSSLPQQLKNFEFTRSKLLIRLFEGFEKFILKNSDSVIVICPDLMQTVKKEGYADKTILLENFIDFGDISEYTEESLPLRENYASSPEQKIVLYTGNFQPYQGIELFLDAAALLEEKEVIFLLVGGSPQAVLRMKQKARAMNIEKRIKFTGQVAPAQVAGFVSLADVLVSPRLSGTNTPLKIYSYLKSGQPLVATKLWTHTQMLDDSTAILVEPDAESLAEGISTALHKPEALARAEAARQSAVKKYTYPQYLETMRAVLARAEKKHSKG